MSKAIAVVAGVAGLGLLGATYVVTQGRSTTDCPGTAVATDSIGGPFELVSETGAVVTQADVISEPALIYFGYTFCPDVCPIDNMRNAQAVDLLAEQGHSVTPVFITVDPERDTVDVVRSYTDNFHDKMIGLTGSAEQVAEAAGAYRVVYGKADSDPEFYLVNHSVFTYLVLPETGFAEFFRREDGPEAVAERVACILDAASV